MCPLSVSSARVHMMRWGDVSGRSHVQSSLMITANKRSDTNCLPNMNTSLVVYLATDVTTAPVLASHYAPI